jgi:tyrosyl-tRNA synthetase
MSKGDGMSFAEFTYPLMQAWDWWHMYHTKGIQMQIGGSDQYGNITAGIEAVKYISKHHPNPDTRKIAETMKDPFGFTVPLLTTSSGVKFGKSAGNAIWLDSEQTSTFELYGYFLRTSDADVGKYLKMFTFMPIEQIDALVKEHMESPSQRKAQHALAREFVELIHGAHEAKMAEQQHRLLFRKSPPIAQEQPIEPDTDAKGGITTLNNKPKINIKLPRTLIHTKSIGRIIQACGLAETASEGHRLAQNSGVYIGGHPDGKKLPMNDGFVSWAQVKAWRPEDTQKFLVHGDLLMFRKGKHNIRIVQVVSDDEYERSGERYAGMDKNWRGQLDGTHEEKEKGEVGERVGRKA